MDGLTIIKGANEMKCMHEGCKRTTVVDCVPRALQDYFENTDLSCLTDTEKQTHLSTKLVYFCLEHTTAHGYCWQCGFESAGVRAVEVKVNNGLCPKCYAAWRQELLGIGSANGGNKNGGDAAAMMVAV